MEDVSKRDFFELMRQSISGGKELPGFDAHKIMAPLNNGKFFRKFTPSENSTHSAVMLILFRNKYSYYPDLLFTLRSGSLARHAGQISFPGGRSEPGETPEETALRETSEEIGIDANNLLILGRLSRLFVPPSDTTITPVISEYKYNSPETPELTGNSSEVAEIFKIPLEQLLNDNHIKHETWLFNQIPVKVPFFDVHPTTPLWGATAMILMELIQIVKKFVKFSG